MERTRHLRIKNFFRAKTSFAEVGNLGRLELDDKTDDPYGSKDKSHLGFPFRTNLSAFTTAISSLFPFPSQVILQFQNQQSIVQREGGNKFR